MGLAALTRRQWISVAISVAVLALGIVVVQRALDAPKAVRIALAALPGRSVDTADDAPTTATTVTTQPGDTTTAAPTTTMPPRAQPVRLAPTDTGPLLGTVIIVDPGHNGRNYLYSDVKRAGSLDGDGPSCNTAGASTNAGLDEMVINWQVGTRLATLLRGLGAEVIMTHGDLEGFGPCADERGAIARDANATALISIHADGSGGADSGFHIIYPAPKPELDATLVAESARLARAVRDELEFVGGRPADYVGSNGVQERSDLANLNTANRPSILAELGNLRNTTDAVMLSSDTTYVQIARALARAVLRYLGKRPDGIAAVSADLDGDGWPDFIAGAPQLAATTTTSTTSTTTSTIAPPVDDTTPSTAPDTSAADPNGTVPPG